VRYRRVPLDNLIRPILEKEARRTDVRYRTARFNLPAQYRPGAAWQAFPRSGPFSRKRPYHLAPSSALPTYGIPPHAFGIRPRLESKAP